MRPRNSNETPRAISATSSSTSGRYIAENQVAYQPGKAAKIPAAPTISHTSLPSQNGPIVLIATRCSVSVRPDDLVQHADAEVEPLQDEEAGPEERDDQEPQVRQGHRDTSSERQRGDAGLVVVDGGSSGSSSSSPRRA